MLRERNTTGGCPFSMEASTTRVAAGSFKLICISFSQPANRFTVKAANSPWINLILIEWNGISSRNCIIMINKQRIGAGVHKKTPVHWIDRGCIQMILFIQPRYAFRALLYLAFWRRLMALSLIWRIRSLVRSYFCPICSIVTPFSPSSPK